MFFFFFSFTGHWEKIWQRILENVKKTLKHQFNQLAIHKILFLYDLWISSCNSHPLRYWGIYFRSVGLSLVFMIILYKYVLSKCQAQTFIILLQIGQGISLFYKLEHFMCFPLIKTISLLLGSPHGKWLKYWTVALKWVSSNSICSIKFTFCLIPLGKVWTLIPSSYGLNSITAVLEQWLWY